MTAYNAAYSFIATLSKQFFITSSLIKILWMKEVLYQIKISSNDKEEDLHTNKVGSIVRVNILEDVKIVEMTSKNLHSTFVMRRLFYLWFGLFTCSLFVIYMLFIIFLIFKLSIFKNIL